MSPRSVLVVLVAVLMVASVFAGGLGTVLAHRGGSSAAAPAVASPSVSTLTYEVYDGYGSPSVTFYPGQVRTGSLFFYVADSDTSDKNVNITLTDPNATRDGIPTPAFQYEATLNATTHSYDSYTASVGYAFPASIPYSGGWNLNFSASATDYVDVTVFVYVYYVNLSTSVYGSTLPGQPYQLFWNLTSESNDASFYTHATNAYVSGTYYGNGTGQPLFTHPRDVPLTGVSTGYGVYSGVVPANATPGDDLEFTVWATAIIGGVQVENDSESLYIAVGTLDLEAAGLTEAPPFCDLYDEGGFGTGTTLAGCVEAGSLYRSHVTPIAGLPVTVGYWNGTASVTPTGAPTSLTTNAYGEAVFTFVASSPPFVVSTRTTVFNAVNYSVHAPGADALGYHWTQYANLTWYLVPAAPQFAVVNVTLDRSQYFEGQTAHVSWSIHSSNANLTGPVDPVSWTVFTGTGTLNITPIGGTAQSGTFTVPVTSAMVSGGYFGVAVVAANVSASFSGTAFANVLGPELLLTSPSDYYTAGSTVSVTAVLLGAPGAVISYQAIGTWYDSSSGNLSVGTVTNGSAISVTIPSSDPPAYLYVTAWATLDGAAVAVTGLDLGLAFGYSVQLGVATPSSYSDGSYQPGQTISLSYAIVALDGAPEPAVVSFYLVTVGYPQAQEINNVGPSGTISYTIPSNAPRGSLLIAMEADTDLQGECVPNNECEGLAVVPINPSPSVLSLELGAGSGVTVGWLIVLVLVLVVAAVGAVLVLRGRARRGKGGNPGQGSSSPPEWKPSTAPSTPSGGSPPASPPSGAT